jgi:hypothetical protein
MHTLFNSDAKNYEKGVTALFPIDDFLCVTFWWNSNDTFVVLCWNMLFLIMNQNRIGTLKISFKRKFQWYSKNLIKKQKKSKFFRSLQILTGFELGISIYLSDISTSFVTFPQNSSKISWQYCANIADCWFIPTKSRLIEIPRKLNVSLVSRDVDSNLLHQNHTQ